MLKYCHLALLGVALSACAAGPEANTPESAVSEAKLSEDQPHEKAELQEDKPNEMQAHMKEFEIKTYWQKRPGTPVYDSNGDVVGSLRLRPTIKVYEVKEGWSRVSPDMDEWVKSSDLTDIEPDDVPRPRESTGLDDLDREALKRAVETGVSPGDQK